MNRLNLFFLIVSFSGLWLLTSCSGDDEPAEAVPSRVISRIDIYKGTNGESKYAATLNFIYNGDKLMKIGMEGLEAEINYTYYSADSLSYSHIYRTGTETVWNKVTARLEEGNIRLANSTIVGDLIYSYKDGYVSTAMIGGKGIVLDYKFATDGLKVISLKDNGVYYDSEYIASDVVNDYSIDLNVLSQLIDPRSEYTEVMNTCAQIINVLGKKYRYLLEDKKYEYDYEYYKDGRISSVYMSIKENNGLQPDTYKFRIRYEE